MEPEVMVALIAAVMAAVTSLAAAGLSYWGGRQARDQALAAKHTERFGKAAEQIGSEEPAVRVAGVYAMAALADEWEEQRPHCVEVLCGYMRLPPHAGKGEDQVRLTVVGVMRKHLQANAPASWSGLDFDLSGARFPHGTNFEGAVFDGEGTTFDWAQFNGFTSFERTKFSGHARFNHAEFQGLTWFYEASFTGPAWFYRATFCEDAVAAFAGATFKDRASFGGARLKSDIDLVGAQGAGPTFVILPNGDQREGPTSVPATWDEQPWTGTDESEADLPPEVWS